MEAKSKDIIRKEMKDILKSLERPWVDSASLELSTKLDSLFGRELGGVNVILAWLSFFAGEPDLSELIIRELSRKKIYLPRSLTDFSLEFISAGTDWKMRLKPGLYGIPEPEAEPEKTYKSNANISTAILVPGLAFDSSGRRLGRGKGYYDRFLAQPGNEKIIKIGIGWSMQVLEKVPTSEHDIKMDWICTEKEILKT